MTRRTASVVWELSEDEGMVVVDVDAPLRPFGGLTPSQGTRSLPVSNPLSDDDALSDPMSDPPAGVPKPEGVRRTLPPLGARRAVHGG